MSFAKTYKVAAELPALVFPWQVQNGSNVWVDLDLSTGYTLSSSLTSTKTGVITVVQAPVGSLGYFTQGWAVNDLNLAADSTYLLKVKALEIATGKDRWYSAESWPIIRLVT